MPVPKPYALCQDDSVIGTAFYIMQFLPGRVFADVRMPGISPADRGKIFDSMNDVLARLHNVDYRAVGLGDYGREGQYIQRQVSRWSSQYDLARTEDIESMEALKKWLPENIPPGDETRINHGDYRLGNTIVHPTEPRVIAVLDWELSTLGHPLADLGYNCMMYHFGEGFGASGGYAGQDLKAFGIPTEQEYLARLRPPHRSQGSAGLELLPRLLAVPPRRHRAGRLQAWPRRQCLVGDGDQVRQPRPSDGRPRLEVAREARLARAIQDIHELIRAMPKPLGIAESGFSIRSFRLIRLFRLCTLTAEQALPSDSPIQWNRIIP